MQLEAEPSRGVERVGSVKVFADLQLIRKWKLWENMLDVKSVSPTFGVTAQIPPMLVCFAMWMANHKVLEEVMVAEAESRKYTKYLDAYGRSSPLASSSIGQLGADLLPSWLPRLWISAASMAPVRVHAAEVRRDHDEGARLAGLSRSSPSPAGGAWASPGGSQGLLFKFLGQAADSEPGNPL